MGTERKHEKLVFELLIMFTVVVGILLVVGSFLPGIGRIGEVLRGIGLSLFPAGVVAILIYLFASRVAEISLKAELKKAVGDRLDEHMRNIGRKVTDGLNTLDDNMKKLSPVFVYCAERGVESVHLNRGGALERFAWFLDSELKKALQGDPARIWIVCSSMKGFINAVGEHFNGRRVLERIADCRCDFRIIMTDPMTADARAAQEGRAPGEIPDEIKMTLARLKRTGIYRESIKFYQGTPTVFSIATMDRMLLNPYPYESEAFACFSMIVYKTLDPDADIFHQYLQFHFEKPWNHARAISPNEWDRLR